MIASIFYTLLYTRRIMHKQRSKRSELWRIFSILVVFPLSVGILLTLSVFYVLGYRFDFATHEVAQGGLIQFDSHPRGAQVTIDGQIISGKTATKLDATAGSHTVTMALAGYQPWQKSITVNPGKILWLNYARFIPQSIKTDVQVSYPHIDSALSVRGTSLIYVWPEKTKPVVTQIYGNTNQVKQKSIEIPSDTYTAASDANTSRFQLIDTDSSGSYLLVNHTYDNVSEWLYIDVDTPSHSVNLSRVAGASISHIEFDKSNNRRVYMIVENSFVTYDVGSQILSKPIVGSVAEISGDSDGTVMYVSLPDTKTAQRTIGYVSKGDTHAKVLRTFYDNGTTPLHFLEENYVDSHYFAIQYGSTVEISAGLLPASSSTDTVLLQNVATISLTDPSSQMSFSPSSRFIIIQSGTTFMTYDLELGKLSTTSQRGDGNASPLAWLDQTSIVSTRGGSLQYYEFDGENSHTLLGDVMANTAVFSPDQRFIYCLQTQSDGSVKLVRVHLVVNQ